MATTEDARELSGWGRLLKEGDISPDGQHGLGAVNLENRVGRPAPIIATAAVSGGISIVSDSVSTETIPFCSAECESRDEQSRLDHVAELPKRSRPGRLRSVSARARVGHRQFAVEIDPSPDV